MKASEFISKLVIYIAKNGDFDIDIEMSNIADGRGGEFVDLGLPSGTLWAKCNYGANKETSYGELYKWDEAMKLPIQLPTMEQFEELIEHTTSEWTEDYKGSGVNGYKFTSKTDISKYIFIPASGIADNGSVDGRNSDGRVWSSSIRNIGDYDAWYLVFDSSYMGMSSLYRCNGRSVRGVVSKFYVYFNKN